MTAFEQNMTGVRAELCDVIVIGGGPGGSAVSALLAQQGLNVVVVEKDRHPRFHIGESLLPQSLPILERLGVLERVKQIGTFKPGAEFISEKGTRSAVFSFDRALLGGPTHAYQVPRDKFDQLLFERAKELGAQTLDQTKATILSCDEEATIVATEGPEGEQRVFQAAFLVDASGRSTVAANRETGKKPDPRNTSAAVFGHFRNVPRMEGPRGGNIRIFLNQPGWMWLIPLPNGITSMGLVAPGSDMANRGGALETFFRERAGRNPEFARLLENAEPVGKLRATGNFSYRTDHAYGPGHIKVGDAYGFIDPIFSTGVHLALGSGQDAAEVILRSRAAPGQRARLLRAYERKIIKKLKFVSWFIYSIHDPDFRHMLLTPKDWFGTERAIISLLAGDFRPNLRLRSRIWLFKLMRRAVRLEHRTKEYQNA